MYTWSQESNWTNEIATSNKKDVDNKNRFSIKHNERWNKPKVKTVFIQHLVSNGNTPHQMSVQTYMLNTSSIRIKEWSRYRVNVKYFTFDGHNWKKAHESWSLRPWILFLLNKSFNTTQYCSTNRKCGNHLPRPTALFFI